MIPRQNKQETVGNNLANVNTAGFKGDKRYFRTNLNSNMLQGGPFGEPLKLTDDEFSLITDFSQGPLIETRNPLNIALNGDGFFVIETGEMVGYTRNGNFAINAEGEMVNLRGDRLMSESGPIQIIGREVIIRTDGGVVVDGSLVGTIKIVDFEQPYTLKRNGFGYFIPDPPAEGFTPEKFHLQQGFIENSNVDAISEMIQMIELNRNYESCQKSIHAQDESLKQAVNEIAR